MKAALLVVLASGCIPPAEPPPGRDGTYDDGGWMGSGGDPIYGCRQDSECGTQVCARDGGCYPAASDLR